MVQGFLKKTGGRECCGITLAAVSGLLRKGKNGRRVLDDTEDLFAAIKAAEALDEIIIFLGINDICFDREIQIDDILEGVSHMLGLIRERYREIGMKAPEIILIGAVPINETQVKDGFYLLEAGKVRKFSEGLLYLATDAGCGYIDSGRIIESSQSDGIHLEAEEHRKLGLFVAEYTKSFLSNANLNNKRH